MALAKWSAYEGDQVYLLLNVLWDLSEAIVWLYMDNDAVGHWNLTEYNLLAQGCQNYQVGGEVMKPNGGEMGSGYKAQAGHTKACLTWKIKCYKLKEPTVSNEVESYVPDLKIQLTNHEQYTAGALGTQKAGVGFYFGGPKT